LLELVKNHSIEAFERLLGKSCGFFYTLHSAPSGFRKYKFLILTVIKKRKDIFKTFEYFYLAKDQKVAFYETIGCGMWVIINLGEQSYHRAQTEQRDFFKLHDVGIYRPFGISKAFSLKARAVKKVLPQMSLSS